MKRATCARMCAASLLLVAMEIPAQLTDSPMARATSAYARRDYFEAFRLLQPLARDGDAQAQLRLGLMYFHGQGVREDDAEAFQWLRKAATAGLAEAQFHLANMYAFGFGVPAEETDADRAGARWYFESANRGHVEAAHSLGILFLTGKGVVASQKEAMRWFRRAAAGGHAESQRIVEGHGTPR